MRTVYGNHERYEKTYFSQFPGYYKTGDGRSKTDYYNSGAIEHHNIEMKTWQSMLESRQGNV